MLFFTTVLRMLVKVGFTTRTNRVRMENRGEKNVFHSILCRCSHIECIEISNRILAQRRIVRHEAVSFEGLLLIAMGFSADV